jgi:thioredoxin reductase (NADPH)
MTRDVVIVGAGPAGVSAALWARSFGLEARVLESEPGAGGQLNAVHFHPREVPGVAAGDGPAIAATLLAQLAAERIDLVPSTIARGLEFVGERIAVLDAAGQRHEARAALVATGLRRRRLGVPGEEAFEGRGVSFSATRDRDRLAGRDVLVVGGGDAAFENALILAEAGSRVTIAARGAPRAREEFRRRVAANPKIQVLEQTRVTEVLGDARMRGVRLSGPGGTSERAVEGLVIKIGSIPNTEWCRDALACDPEGYIRIDAGGRSSRDRVWAAGDVTRPPLLAIAVAAGQAALALADIRAELRRS